MKIELTYGRKGLIVELPEYIDVLKPKFIPGLTDEETSIRHALQKPIGSSPLAELVNKGDQVVIVHTDITRATPNDRILPVLIAVLEEVGIQREDIVLLNAMSDGCWCQNCEYFLFFLQAEYWLPEAARS